MNIFEPVRKQKRKRNLLEFRAGKMKMENDNWVYPDKRKGLVFIHQTQDGLMHFCWKDRNSGQIEDDLIIFPNETSFQRLYQCTTGRVYLLKFKDAKKLFLWMQEPLEDKDAELCQSVNDLLNQNLISGSVDQSKQMNLNDFTNLLGELHNIGALNDLDIMEILGSPISAESDMSNQPTTNPFPIGNIPSASTNAEIIQTNEALRNKSDSKDTIKDSNINKSINEASSKTDDLSEFNEQSLLQISKNLAFRTKLLNNVQENQEVDINSKDFKNAIEIFSTMLKDEASAKNILKEMGLPENIITRNSSGELDDVKEALNKFYGSKNSKDD